MPSAASLEATALLNRVNYEVIRDARDVSLLKQWISDYVDLVVGVDTETTGLSPHRDRVRLVQLGANGNALIVDLDGFRDPGVRQVDWISSGLSELKELLEGPTSKVLQNAAFDLNFLRGEGIELGGFLFDTMIAAKIINNGSGGKNDLGSLVERNLNVVMPKELQKADWSGRISTDMYEYAAKDVVCLPLLAAVLSDRLIKCRIDTEINPHFRLWDLFLVEMDALQAIATMQWHGFAFDHEEALLLREQLVATSEALQLTFLEHLDREIRARGTGSPEDGLPRNPDGTFNTREKDTGSVRLGTKLYAGFNPRSAKQMAGRFEQAGILLPKDATGKLSLDQNLLAFCAINIRWWTST